MNTIPQEDFGDGSSFFPTLRVIGHACHADCQTRRIVITLPRSEIPGRRRAVLLALLPNASSQRRATLKAHLASFQDATAAVSPGENHIRSWRLIGAPRCRHWPKIDQTGFERGEQAGFRHFRLDVETGNAATLKPIVVSSLGLFTQEFCQSPDLPCVRCC